MKRFLILGTLLACTMLTAQAQFNGGTGTADDPYLIRRPAQLANLSTILNQEGVYVKLQSDIDLTSYLEDEEFADEGWVPIGTSSEPFKGTVIGNGKKIKGLFINRPAEANVGLFGYLDGADISDLTIEATTITGSSNIGTLAGYATNCSITNCHVTISYSLSAIDEGNAGGLLGMTSNSIISNSKVLMSGTSIAVKGKYVGGTIGVSSKCTITDCNVETSITNAEVDYFGGFTGNAIDGTTIDNVTVNIVQNSNNDYIGGLMGHCNNTTISNAIVIGEITGLSYVAGIIADAEGSNSISDCKYIGNLKGQSYVGGIAANLRKGGSSIFSSCRADGIIDATGDYVGGVVGCSQGACVHEMVDCSHFGDIVANNHVGGIIGAIVCHDNRPKLSSYMVRSQNWATGGKLLAQARDYIKDGYIIGTSHSIRNCLAVGNICANDYVGGIVGYEQPSYEYTAQEEKRTCSDTSASYKYLIKDSVYTGFAVSNKYTMSWPINAYTRGLLGILFEDNSYSGIIEAKNNVGGIAGQSSGGSFVSNFANAKISGEDNVGGIIGYETPTEFYTQNNNHKVNVTSNVIVSSSIKSISKNVGRIMGFVQDENYTNIGELNTNFSNRASEIIRVISNGVLKSTEDSPMDGMSMTTSDLRSEANYMAWGWDFENNWKIINNESWPYKTYQTAPPAINSSLALNVTEISGQCIDNGTIYLAYNDLEPISIKSENKEWTTTIAPMQSGAKVTIYAEAEGLAPSYPVTHIVKPQGKGTEEEPYLLYTAYDLQGICENGYYKLMNNIDLTSWIANNSPSEGWKPIGRDGIEGIIFNGNNFAIKGLWSNTDDTYNGLFASLSEGSLINNLSVVVATGKKLQGGIVAGILTGYATNTIFENCMVNGSVETSDYAGGLIGYAEGGSILQCCLKGNVTATGSEGYAGGLVAYCSTPISNSYSAANVDATECVAGLVGYSSSTIDKCYAQGNITGAKYGAGLVAQLSGESAAITNSVALNGTITMTDEYASASRVLNSNINGCPDPDDSNLALKTTQLTLNGKTEKIYDDEWEGQGKTLDELFKAGTYKALGWDFTNIWGIMENETPPYLFYEIKQGDVNFDGQVDMTDAVCIVYYYLGELPGIFVEKTADLNGDGRIDLTDAIMVVYQYLGEGNAASARALLEEITENEPQ